MSFDALAWAAKQNTGSSGTKLVLLGLAECAHRKTQLAFPSIAELVEFSSLDRKSVIANLDRLEKMGLIEDTGRRCGRTNQIKIYLICLDRVAPETEASQKRNSSDFSANSPKNGTRNQSEPVSVTSVTGLPPSDDLKNLFDIGVSLLTSAGVSEKEARSMLGKWRKAKSDADVLAAVIDCRARAISNPVEWIEARFRSAKYVSPSGYEYRGDDRAVMREAEKRADWSTYWKAQRAVEGKQAA